VIAKVSWTYYPPQRFVDDLEAAFRGRLRIRWSHQAFCWVIEERVGRAAFLPPPVKNRRLLEIHDNTIRKRDGYALAMEIQPHEHFGCPKCSTELVAPRFETREVTCPTCKSKGLDARVKAAWYPLDGRLIDFLKSIDPQSDHNLRDRVAAEDTAVIRDKRLVEEAQDRENRAQLYDAALEQLPKAGFPSLVSHNWHH
jgi:Zn finger protein HypA/HybF involved in hydrogenase expression